MMMAAIRKSKRNLDGGYDSFDHYASANVTTNTRNIVLTKPKSTFWGMFDPSVKP